jgi:hypothetical protein
MKHFSVILLAILSLLLYNHADSQNLRIGVGVMPVPYTLRVQGLGPGIDVSTSDHFTLTLAVESDITPALTLGVGIQARGGRWFALQFDTDGRHIGWSNTQLTRKPYYQSAFSIPEAVELPLTLRYRLSDNELSPFVRAEYCLAIQSGEGYAVRYLTEGGGTSVITDAHAARMGSTMHAVYLAAGLEARVNPWFSFIMDIGWKHTFSSYMNEDFMRVRELDTMTARLTLMATVVDGW